MNGEQSDFRSNTARLEGVVEHELARNRKIFFLFGSLEFLRYKSYSPNRFLTDHPFFHRAVALRLSKKRIWFRVWWKLSSRNLFAPTLLTCYLRKIFWSCIDAMIMLITIVFTPKEYLTFGVSYASRMIVEIKDDLFLDCLIHLLLEWTHVHNVKA